MEGLMEGSMECLMEDSMECAMEGSMEGPVKTLRIGHRGAGHDIRDLAVPLDGLLYLLLRQRPTAVLVDLVEYLQHRL